MEIEKHQTRIVRESHIAECVLFLDGLTGTGKTMMGPILGSFERVELGRFDHIHEYLCILNSLGKVEDDAGRALVKMYTDLALYNSMIGRETNFRPSDLSGVFSNPKSLRYLKRLVMPDGNVVMTRIANEKPILNLISHQALSAMGLAFKALEGRLRIVEMVRHPLYLLDHWESYIERFGTDVRDFTIWLGSNGDAIPWFAQTWEKKYKESSPFDRVIYSIDHLMRGADALYESLPPEFKKNVLYIPFEKFVLNPDEYIKQIEVLIQSKATKLTSQSLKKQMCPRTQVTAGPAKPIYKRYAWVAPEKDVSDKEDMEKKRQTAKKRSSSQAFETLERLCREYEARYGLWY